MIFRIFMQVNGIFDHIWYFDHLDLFRISLEWGCQRTEKNQLSVFSKSGRFFLDDPV